MAKAKRVHYSGMILFYAGPSALCWKHPRGCPEEQRSLNKQDVTCPRCLLMLTDIEARSAALRGGTNG